MKVALFLRKDLCQNEIESLLLKYIDFTIDEKNPEFVFSCGGDGTFLDAVGRYGVNPVYIPINMGTLGFYCSWGPDSLAQMIEDYNNNNVIKAPMLKIDVFAGQEVINSYQCLNEATIINPINTQILDVYINDFEIEKFRGTGICISTPTGSTAYNKSLGGAIISSRKKLFQLTHMAAINNVKYRNIGNSIILDENELLTFVGENNEFENSVLTVDRNTYNLDHATMVTVSLSSNEVKILVPKDNDFYKRVRKAFID